MSEGLPLASAGAGRQPAWPGLARWAKPLFGLGVSAFFIWLVFRDLSAREIGDALKGAQWSLIPWAVLSLAIGYSARITRWWVMLRPTAPDIRWADAARPFLVSIAANNVLPLRVGDVLRLFAFRGRPGLEAARVGGTLVVERLVDLFVLLAIFAAVLPFVPVGTGGAQLVVLASWAAGAGAVALVGLLLLPQVERLALRRLAGIALVQGSPLAQKMLRAVSALIDTVVQLGSPRRILAIVSLSVLAWLFEGGVFVAAAAAVGVPLSVAGAFFALAVATLSTLLPSSPGYVGTFHFFAMQAAVTFGALQADAVAFAILAHLLLWLPTTVAGLLAFLGSTLSAGRSAPSFAASSGPPH